MEFFDLGFLEILVIFVVALLVIGPERLPEYAKKLGKMLRDLRKMTKNLTGEVTNSLNLNEEIDDLKNTAQGLKGSLDEESLKIKNALDLEADEIAKTIDTEVKGVKKTIDDGTTDLAALLEKESIEFDKTAQEMKTSLDGEARELNKTLNEGVQELNKTLKIDNGTAAKNAKTGSSGKGTGASRKRTGETPAILDTAENAVPQENTVPEQDAKETASPDKKDDSKDAGI
jgi:sec-independent protein translocase protein TatB